MNVGMLVSNYLPRQGGAEYAVHHLTTALIQEGHQVTILTEADPAISKLSYPYPLYQSLRLPLLTPNLKRLLHTWFHYRRRRFDLIHAHMAWPVAGFVGEKLKRWFRLP